ncbi:MAG: hypothetical protein KIT39_18440 [Nitrospirales bacterium]|nr:hypothetical protein [Nitrospirales bacterium]
MRAPELVRAGDIQIIRADTERPWWGCGMLVWGFNAPLRFPSAASIGEPYGVSHHSLDGANAASICWNPASQGIVRQSGV